MNERTGARILATVVALLAVTGCARYVTPGGGAALPGLADADIQDRLERKPTASFPARLAMARVQAPGYRSLTNQGYGSGRYTLVTTRDVEREGDFERLGRLPMVAGVGPLNRLLLPSMLDSFKDLRLAAASLRADMLLIYTFDTSFHVGGSAVPPLSVMSLGILPMHEAVVTTTASAVVYDVQTAFIYGLAEATARESQMTSFWTSRTAVDDARLRTEAQAFEKLMAELEKTWIGIVAEHAPKSAGQPASAR
jgi:hypothetical protein